MNTKYILGSVAALALTASLTVGAQPRDMQVGSRTRVNRLTATSTTTTSGMTTFRQRHFRNRTVVFVDEFGFPFFPYPYYYPYGYYYYNQPAYGNVSIVVEVQTRLARAGYYHGAIDGVMGPRTRYAIRVFERAHGLRVDGMISQQLMATMGLRTRGGAY